MSAGINPARISAVIVTAGLLAGCGAAAKQATSTGSGVASAPGAGHALRTTGHIPHPARKATGPGQVAPGALAFSKCMRANGVPDFPDPTAGKGFGFQVNSSVSSTPAFRSAQTKCQRLLPGGPGFQAKPSKRTMAKLLRIATCMRAHRIHQFPDPLYDRPRHFTPGEYQEITDFDGATLLFPTTMNLQAPAYRHALTVCGAPPLGLPHRAGR